MASNLNDPAYAYTVVYVKDVAKSVAFYSKAFGYNVRRLDQSHRSPCKSPTIITSSDRTFLSEDFAFDRTFADVDAAYKTAVSPPEAKEWGQRVAYVRDIDGIVVRLGSFVKEPTSSH